MEKEMDDIIKDSQDCQNYDSNSLERTSTGILKNLHISQQSRIFSQNLEEIQQDTVRFDFSTRDNRLLKESNEESAINGSIISEMDLKQKIAEKFKLLMQDPFNQEEINMDEGQVYFNVQQFLVRNMGFWGRSLNFKKQIKICISICIIFFTLVFYPEIILENSIDLLMGVLALTMMTIIIALRYGTTSESKLNDLRSRVYPEKELNQEYLTSWLDLDISNIDKEIKHSMIRNEIENLTFHNMFLSKLPIKLKERINDYHFFENNKYTKEEFKKQLTDQSLLVSLKLKKSSKNISIRNQTTNSKCLRKFESIANAQDSIIIEDIEQDPKDEEMLQRHSSRLFFKDLVIATKYKNQKANHKFYYIVSIIHALLPFILTLGYKYSTKDDDPNWNQQYSSVMFWFYTVACFNINAAVYYNNTVFQIIGIIDFKRKRYLQKLMTKLIEIDRYKAQGYQKIMPLINIFDRQSMLCWLDMRILALDFGKRYFIRIQLYAAQYILIYVLLSALYLAEFFDAKIHIFTTYQWIPLILEILNFLHIIMYSLCLAAQINEETEKQIFRITELRNILDRLLADWNHIMEAQGRGNKLLNQTYKLAYQYYTCCLKIKTVEECKKELKQTVQVLLSIQERLEKENQYSPVKLLGIPMTKTISYTLFSGLASLALAMIQYKLGII
ncbi:UNKNOWN [Stylonychia lemnae]|uniref:Transmembrane protein n=1 Tax=Stylonychia lemnae TaxID=5949 RepID=A0A078AS72_STYLE|nr:UNKNOWN [Stylonychia lemnae]|eukprot:CDW83738.1 UNKNOWN [Stylonychia lemnae]